MSEGRFSQLERDVVEAEEQPAAAPAPRVERTIEREDGLEVDESGPVQTHFCRACEAENRPHLSACFNCGAALGCQGQEAFDAVKRRELAAEREQLAKARSRTEAVEEARKTLRKQQEAELGPHKTETPTSPAPLLRDPRLALLVLGVCVFSTVSATLHLFLSAAYAEVPWSVLAEVAIATVTTWIVFTGLRQRA